MPRPHPSRGALAAIASGSTVATADSRRLCSSRGAAGPAGRNPPGLRQNSSDISLPPPARVVSLRPTLAGPKRLRGPADSCGDPANGFLAGGGGRHGALSLQDGVTCAAAGAGHRGRPPVHTAKLVEFAAVGGASLRVLWVPAEMCTPTAAPNPPTVVGHHGECPPAQMPGGPWMRRGRADGRLSRPAGRD